MAKLDDVTDYLITKASTGGVQLNALKLQKLVYYTEAWWLAFNDGKPLTGAEFQAWVHGPVSRDLYDRFKESKSLYSPISLQDIRPDFSTDALSHDVIRHLDNILEAYGGLSGSQLEEMSHNEDPWISARGNCRPSERCENVIDPKLMAEYFAKRLQ